MVISSRGRPGPTKRARSRRAKRRSGLGRVRGPSTDGGDTFCMGERVQNPLYTIQSKTCRWH